MSTFDRSTIEPKAVPESICVVVFPYGSPYAVRNGTYTIKDAHRDAANLAADIKRHCDDIADIDTRYDEFACAVCGTQRDTQEIALDCCAAKCPECSGSGLLPSVKDEDGVRRAHTCPGCYQGRIPDPGEWAYHHPEGEAHS